MYKSGDKSFTPSSDLLVVWAGFLSYVLVVHYLVPDLKNILCFPVCLRAESLLLLPLLLFLTEKTEKQN